MLSGSFVAFDISTYILCCSFCLFSLFSGTSLFYLTYILKTDMFFSIFNSTIGCFKGRIHQTYLLHIYHNFALAPQKWSETVQLDDHLVSCFPTCQASSPLYAVYVVCVISESSQICLEMVSNVQCSGMLVKKYCSPLRANAWIFKHFAIIAQFCNFM